MELKTLFSEDTKKELAGREIVVKQFSLSDLPYIFDLIQKVFGDLPNAKNDIQVGLFITKALASDFSAVLNLIVRLTNLDKKEVERLNLAAATKILEFIIEENIDFLLQNVLPSLKGLAGKLTGSIKSSSSLSTDTAKRK